MQMKINFNKLFQFDDSHSYTPSTKSLQNSYHLEEPSMIQSSSNNINLHYKFSEALFFDNSVIQQNVNANILQDLPAMGKSFQNSFQKESSERKLSPKAKRRNFIRQQNHHSQFISQPQSYLNIQGHNQKAPGQRLYYESKVNKQRKQREIQKVKQQIQQQKNKQVTFKPTLNQNSKKILQLAQSPIRKENNLKKSDKKIEQQKCKKSTVQQKQEQSFKNCTFRPVTNQNKDKYLSTTSMNEKQPNKKFQQLYNQHKQKEARKKLALLRQQQQLVNKSKKMSKQQLYQFFHKNQQYIQQRQHKEEIMRAVSQQYDLTTGRRLFEPKVSQHSLISPFGSTSILPKNASLKVISTPSPKVKKIGQNQDQYAGQSSTPQGYSNTNQENRVNKRNSKLKKPSQKQKTYNKTNRSTPSLIINNKFTSSKNPNTKSSAQKNNIQPYQMSKEYQRNLQKQDNNNQTNGQMIKPNPSLFSKLKNMQPSLQQRHQQQQFDEYENNVQQIEVNRNQQDKISEGLNRRDKHEQNKIVGQEYCEQQFMRQLQDDRDGLFDIGGDSRNIVYQRREQMRQHQWQQQRADDNMNNGFQFSDNPDLQIRSPSVGMSSKPSQEQPKELSQQPHKDSSSHYYQQLPQRKTSQIDEQNSNDDNSHRLQRPEQRPSQNIDIENYLHWNQEEQPYQNQQQVQQNSHYHHHQSLLQTIRRNPQINTRHNNLFQADYSIKSQQANNQSQSYYKRNYDEINTQTISELVQSDEENLVNGPNDIGNINLTNSNRGAINMESTDKGTINLANSDNAKETIYFQTNNERSQRQDSYYKQNQQNSNLNSNEYSRYRHGLQQKQPNPYHSRRYKEDLTGPEHISSSMASSKVQLQKQSTQISPKKQPINIASLLRVKKKKVTQTQQGEGKQLRSSNLIQHK